MKEDVMDPSIRSIVPRPRYATQRASDRKRESEREFVLPTPEESEEDEVVLEPQPRRERGELAVSRERLEDEAGQNIDIQG